MLEVRNLSVWYGLTEVLRDVSFSVPDGRIVAMLGGNGAGKTTLLNALTGLVRPRSGQILFENRPMQQLHPHDVVVGGISMVPQGRYVWPTMSVADNVELGAVTRRDRAAIRRDAEQVYALFPALAERRSSRAGSLSGGQQQMLAIARALMSRPRLLLMDEP
ncbi:MAG: ATP-binding cassette domain-containing protein, partial [Gammaproteobacteria bacterium]|nr:ATP-binding cassette domain-containing protein [Gammaproteobacteria bacterium]